MNKPRAPSMKSVMFWLTFVVLGLLLLATSRVVGPVQRIDHGQRYEAVRAADAPVAVGPETPRLPGPLLSDEARIPLPYFDRNAQVPGLKRVRFQIDLSRYLRGEDACCEGQARAPAKSLLISQALDGMDLYLNGVWIAGLPKSDAQVRFKWYRPLQAPLARRLIRTDGPNLLTVELTTWDPYVRIAPIYIGDTDGITTIYELTYFIGTSLANASNLFCLLAGMFMLGAWLASRKDGAVFLHAGATTVLWSLLFSLVLLPYVPVAWMPLWLWLQYACMGAVVVVLTLFILAFVNEPLPRRMRVVLIAVASAACVLYPWIGPSARQTLDLYWLPLLWLFHLYACSRLALHVARTRSRAAMSLLFQSVLAQAFALRDHNTLVQFIAFQMPDAGWTLSHLLAAPLFLSHLSVPLLLFVVAQILLTKFQQSVKRIRDHNRILTESLQQRERELQVSYNRQRDMESEAAAQAERDRIYRDLHDGIGSKLVTTLFSVRDREINHAQLEARLLDALRDIREIISVTEVHEHRSIQDVLFTYCSNLDEALSRSEFHVEYEISEGPEVVLLSDLSRQVMRIVEESVANTIKYANATRLCIRLSLLHGDLLEVCIEDDGRPRDDDAADPRSDPAWSGGTGLAGLQQRAERIGADYRFERTPAGARTRLRLPLTEGEARAASSPPARVLSS